ncbi:MAG: choice-of-anchor B family protein [Planctomycetes bacterium]|nr:choice-of-anchor B family protein [Planctomycetota bacterium]
MLERGSPLAIIIVGALLVGTGRLSPPVAQAQFPSNNVSQHAWLDLSALSASNGNDCWGYTSPSGREYALMGLNDKLSVVEITTPTSPVIVGTISHSNSIWADIKVYGTYCYVVNESGGGLDVVDLSNVDSGTVTLVQRYTGGGLSNSHNVAINTDSGYLYLIGSNLNGGAPVVLSLANPAAPVEVGRWTEGTAAYHHDAHIVSYTSGPYAGQEILFGFSAGRGVDIVDVTDKSNITLLSRTPYPGVQYCHQGWTSPDLRYLYVDDELDEGVTTPTTRTLIFDIADLSNPFLASTFTTGLPSRDHNLYVRDCVLYEANYSTGLRVINISDPLNPVEVGFYDTYPPNNNVNFNGAWSVYPFFPSGTVIISDIERGLFVLDVSAALAVSAAIPGGLLFDFPGQVPSQIDPAGGTTMQVNVSGTCGGIPQAGTGQLHYDIGGGLVTVPMADLGGGQYEATFPAVTCPDDILFYVSAQSTDGGTFTSPPDAPATLYSATAALGTNVLFADNFETDTGWVATNTGASSGDWQRGVPVNDPGWDYDPISDSDGSGQCYLTENLFGNTDVDGHGERVRLTSPLLDLSSSGVLITYDYYLYLTNADGTDKLLVEIRDGGGGGAGPWIEIARHDTSGGLSWRSHVITENDMVNAGVTLSSGMNVRFTINDDDSQSIVEGGLDAFAIQTFDCGIGRDGTGNGNTISDGGTMAVGVHVLKFVSATLGVAQGTILNGSGSSGDSIVAVFTDGVASTAVGGIIYTYIVL